MEKIICGIQQMGIGVPNVQEIWKWYRKFFGIDVKVFEDAAEAPLMIEYTGNEVHKRTATLALSMEGGGGFEIWQFTSRPTNKASFEIKLGDFGLYSCRIKSKNIDETYRYFKVNGADLLTEVVYTPNNHKHFFVKDPNGNIFNIVESSNWFSETNHPSKCGAVAGTMIGVSNIDRSISLYKDILGYSKVEYDVIGEFEDLKGLPDGSKSFRRVLLSHPEERQGPFAKLLGETKIELIQAIDSTNCKKIFENRYWGDWGFIHLCFDIQGMDALKEECESKGYRFTVDSSNTFDMGEAGGRFSYIEDKDGTLIEFVETHKVPVLKKIGWYINLKNRDPKKNLPKWMLKAMGLNRVKN
ncbi:MAG: VOC family protein [Flavobacteriia bacterium]|nr:VOC family protein [Flavobacteriia bacterium]